MITSRPLFYFSAVSICFLINLALTFEDLKIKETKILIKKKVLKRNVL